MEGTLGGTPRPHCAPGATACGVAGLPATPAEAPPHSWPRSHLCRACAPSAPLPPSPQATHTAQPLLQQPHPQTPGTSLPASRTACVLPLCVSFRASSTSLPHPVCPGPTTGTASAIRAPGPLRILFPSHPLPCPLTLPSLWKSYVILCSGRSLLTKPRPLLCSKWDTGVGETWPCPQDLRDTGCTES